MVARAGAFADVLLRDVRYAGRLLRRNPLFTLTASLSLAIGIGANTTIFTVANALLFRPPVGVAAPDRIVDIGRSQNGSGFDNNSYPNFVDVRRRATTLEDVYAYRLGAEPMSLAGVGDTAGAERVFGSIVTANYFAVLGVRPAVGRLFGAGDSDEPGANPLLVLSHRFWTRRFMNDPSALGRTLQINGHPFTVAGVAPEGFVAAQTLDEYTALNLVPQRVGASVSGSLGAVGLLLAAIGIYGVMAYAVTPRTREIGIRIALGAQRLDVVGLVVRQGMSLAVIGAAIGLCLAAAASRLLTTFLFGVGPVDLLTFAGAALLFGAIGLAACYLPARRATRIDAMEALRYE